MGAYTFDAKDARIAALEAENERLKYDAETMRLVEERARDWSVVRYDESGWWIEGPRDDVTWDILGQGKTLAEALRAAAKE